MALYRANDRHPADSRILYIQDIKEFDLWRERSKLKIHGIICPCPIDLNSLKSDARLLAALSKSKENYFRERWYNISLSPPYFTFEKDKKRNFIKPAELKSIMEDENVPEHIIKMSETMVNVYYDQTSTRFFQATLRVNNLKTAYWHVDKNSNTLTCAFSKAGARCRSGNGPQEGDEYDLGIGDIAFIDDTVWHTTPPADENREKDPRVHLVI